MIKQVLVAAALCASTIPVHSARADVLNDPPVAVNDTASGQCGSFILIQVTQNDYDPDGDTLTVISGYSSNGNVDPQGANIEFEPQVSGTAYVYYTISDGNGGTDVGEVVVDVRRNRVC